MEPTAKRQKLDEKMKRQKATSLEISVGQFRKKIKEGPYYICLICNRILYRKSVVILDRTKYDNRIHHLFTGTKSFDSKEYA